MKKIKKAIIGFLALIGIASLSACDKPTNNDIEDLYGPPISDEILEQRNND